MGEKGLLNPMASDDQINKDMVTYKIPGILTGRILLHLHSISGCVQQF